VEVSEFDHTRSLSLRIRNISYNDYGRYTCKAENFIGSDKQSMILYGKVVCYVMLVSLQTLAHCLSALTMHDLFQE